MKMSLSMKRIFFAAIAVLLAAGVIATVTERNLATGSDPWTPAELITPETLFKELSGPKKPTVVCVAFKILYNTGHVPGSLFFGPGRDQEGLEALKQWAASQPRNKPIVIYCGCCPWSHCPNVRPAFSLLKEMGFSQLQLVEIENDFGRDWRDKGYPVEKSK